MRTRRMVKNEKKNHRRIVYWTHHGHNSKQPGLPQRKGGDPTHIKICSLKEDRPQVVSPNRERCEIHPVFSIESVHL